MRNHFRGDCLQEELQYFTSSSKRSDFCIDDIENDIDDDYNFMIVVAIRRKQRWLTMMNTKVPTAIIGYHYRNSELGIKNV